MYRTLGEIWTRGLSEMRGNRQTDRHIYRHADRNTLHPYRGYLAYFLTYFLTYLHTYLLT